MNVWCITTLHDKSSDFFDEWEAALSHICETQYDAIELALHVGKEYTDVNCDPPEIWIYDEYFTSDTLLHWLRESQTQVNVAEGCNENVIFVVHKHPFEKVEV